MLEPGRCRPAEIKDATKKGENPELGLWRNDFSVIANQVHMTIRYENMEGTRYYSRMLIEDIEKKATLQKTGRERP
jgi:hypothetical protein